MPSILPNYEYDIFISYRQNDNHNGGITEFVDLLKDELATTIKEPISIYFDSNAHDGLLENHSVDKSLEGKLKCLIFIPIISQTYCDTQSFAWQHELLPFLHNAKSEELGIDIKLGNGNVASRVLPIKIHELDYQDQSLLETTLGGVLRAIEFIYKEPGVNRPLKVDDIKSENLNHTDYSNQINKVANAIKEIIGAMNSPSGIQPASSGSIDRIPSFVAHSRKRKFIYFISIIFIVALGYFWFKLNVKDEPILKTDFDKSLVVLPFQDMSPNQDQGWFSDGLAEEMLNRLSKVSELKLISRTTAFAFKGKNLTAKQIADSLGVTYVLEGSVRKANNQFRITAQLINAKDDSHIWSNTYNYEIDSIFAVQDDISENITKALDILLDDHARSNMMVSGTKNVEAYEEHLKGMAFFNKAHSTSTTDSSLFKANIHFEKAILLDPKFSTAFARHHDFFAHYFVERTSGIYQYVMENKTDEKIYDIIIEDLTKAIKFASNREQQLVYELDLIFFSNNWSRLPQLLGQLENNNKASQERIIIEGGWFIPLLAISNPELLRTLYIDQIESDPNDTGKIIIASLALIKMNKLDSLRALLNTNITQTKSNPTLNLQLAKAAMFEGDYRKMYEILNFTTWSSDVDDVGEYKVLSQLLTGNYEGNAVELLDYMNNIDIHAIMFYNALGQYDKADSVARLYDSKFLGPNILARYLYKTSLFFHLSATPNFSARLKELGIDPEQYENDNYYKFSGVEID